MPKVTTLSPGQSVISTDVAAIDADGVEVCTVYVAVKNTDQSATQGGDLEPNSMAGLRGNAVVLAVTPSTGVTITQPSGVADANGTVTGSFVSTNAATVAVSATVLGTAVTSGNASVVVGGGAPVPPAPGDPFFEEDLLVSSLTNDNGFVWSASPASVAVVASPSNGAEYALRFRFGPNADLADSSAQQNFSLGRNVTDLWIEYDLWVPSNYAHRTQASGGTNNKFFRLWGDSYNNPNKVGCSTFTSPSPSTLNFEGQLYTWPGGVGEISAATREPFASFTTGEWVQLRQYYGMVTAAQNDGKYSLWIAGVSQVAVTNLALKYDSGTPYWNQGYLMGWANSGYADQTDFYMRAFKFYSTNPGW